MRSIGVHPPKEDLLIRDAILRKLFSATVLMVIASGCMPHHSKQRPPYLVGGIQYTEAKLQALAADRCRESSGAFASLPPYPFTTDGCSLVPNGPMAR